MATPTLYIVASPIGNLADITLRTLDTLKSVDLIVAEDTRVTRRLLNHYNISKPMRSVREHSADDRITQLIDDMQQGRYLHVAYLSDAGTPNLSDPGGKLVAMARSNGITIIPIPGPSALTTLVQVAGVSLNGGCLFLGFLPKKKGRQTLFSKLKMNRWPVIIYERGSRLSKTLGQFEEIYGGDTMIVIGRELTKKFEEITTFKLADLAHQSLSTKGEFSVLLVPNKKSKVKSDRARSS